jgi:hypothetical protein
VQWHNVTEMNKYSLTLDDLAGMLTYRQIAIIDSTAQAAG